MRETIHAPRPYTPSARELNALAAIYRRAIKRHLEAKAPATSDEEHAREECIACLGQPKNTMTPSEPSS